MLLSVLFLFLLVTGGVNPELCTGTVEEQTQKLAELKQKFTEEKQFLTSNGISEDKVIYEKAGRDLTEFEYCMEVLYGYTPQSDYEKQSNKSADDYFSWLIPSIISVIGIITAYFLARYSVRNTIKLDHEATRNQVLKLVNDSIKKIEDGFKPDTSFIHPATGKETYFVNKHISTTGFDSITSSGYFLSISSDLQIALDEIFSQIIEHNEKLNSLEQISVEARTNPSLINTSEVIVDLITNLSVIENRITQRYLVNLKNTYNSEQNFSN